MQRAEIMAVGSELLTPFRMDTNSLYLTRTLEEYGITLVAKSIIGDDLAELVNAFRVAFTRSDLVIATGGLGPTADDLTKEALAEFLQIKLEFHPEILQNIEARFSRHGLKMPKINEKQAMVPENAKVLENLNGTAPGIYLETRGKQVFLLPGPPYELEPMWTNHGLPLLKKGEPLERKIFRIAMLAESQVDQWLKPVTDSLREVRYTILAAPSQIEVQLLASGSGMPEMISAAAEIRAVLGKHIFTENFEELEEVVGRMLRDNGRKLAVAESCTGGLLGHRITQVPGSSAYFERGVIVYSNEAKIQLLNVEPDLIRKHGAVSSEVSAAMADRIRQTANVDFGLSITGIAGPEGGTEDKPVGTVFVGLSQPNETVTEKYNFPGSRDRVKFASTQAALNLLRLKLLAGS